MRSIFYIGFALLAVQGVCNETTAVEKNKAVPIACEPGTLQVSYNLNWTEPAIDFKISRDSLKQKGGILSIWVKEVKNPGLIPVNFKLFFTDSLMQWTVPGFTLYPADKTGVFNFNISETVKSILTGSRTPKNKEYSLRIMLDTTGFHKKDRTAAKSLFIKICSPVFK